MRTAIQVQAAGQEYPVDVDEETGIFSIYMGGDHGHIRADSLAELTRKARKIKAKFELPFSRVSNDRVDHGKVTGLHATNGNLLVKWDTGKSEQIPAYSGYTSGSMPRLTDEETAEVEALLKARNDAARALDAFLKPRQYDSLKKAAQQAQTAAVEASS